MTYFNLSEISLGEYRGSGLLFYFRVFSEKFISQTYRAVPDTSQRYHPYGYHMLHNLGEN